MKKGGERELSEEKKKKKKVIHVDELVVKADKVVFVDKEGNERDFDRRPPNYPRDPWGFFFPRREVQEDDQNVEGDTNSTGDQEESNQEERRGWRWI